MKEQKIITEKAQISKSVGSISVNGRRRIKLSYDEVIFNVIAYTLAILALVVTLYPLIYTVSASFSDPLEIVKGNVLLLPKKPTLMAYETVAENKSMLSGYKNTIFYTVLGTLINVILTISIAYPLSKKDFYGRNLITILFTIPMFFSGGMIPSFLLIKNLKLYNTFWALILPGAISMWNMVIMRTYFQTSIPEEICESAYIDGCSNVGTLIKIVLPLSKPIISVMILFYGVDHWNSYFSALLYLKDRKLYPLSLVLREILLLGTGKERSGTEIVDNVSDLLLFESLKYAVILVSSVPMLLLYPFLQKYFVKGIMVGSLKG